jgi:hypothetical protein
MAVNQTTLTNPLGPSVAAQPVVGTFANSSAASVYVTRVTVTIASVELTTDPSPAPGGCTAADYVLAPTNGVMTVGQNVAVGNPVGTWGGGTVGAGTAVTIAFANSGSNQDACQGAIVHLAFAIA